MTAGGTGMTETRAARGRHRVPQGVHPPERPRRLLPGHRAAVPQGALRAGRRRLLGGQVLGWDGVDKRIDVLAVALRAGMTVFDLEHLELAYAPPYGSAKDPLNMAGFLGANLLRGDIDLWYPEDYPDCADRGDDPRHPHAGGVRRLAHPRGGPDPVHRAARAAGRGARDKPVCTYCRSGFRSYIAYCVLKQNGFDDVAFLSGGMMTYHGYHRTPLAVGQGGMPMVAHAEDELAQRAGCARPRLTPHVMTATSGRRGARTCGPQHAEGPLWDAATARLWWVDITGERVHCFDPPAAKTRRGRSRAARRRGPGRDRRTGRGQPQRAGGARPRHRAPRSCACRSSRTSPRTVPTTSRSTAGAVRGSARWPTTSGRGNAALYRVDGDRRPASSTA